MSELVWSNTISPPPSDPALSKTYEVYDGKLTIENTKSITKTEKQICSLPDRRAYRSMSRASIILSAVTLEGIDEIKKYTVVDPFSIGIYCAINHGPEDYECAKHLLGTPEEDFAEKYRKSRSPKHYLKQLPNLAPAQLGIFLGVMGPVNTYNHSTHGSFQAMEQAEFDIESERIKLAIVCSAYSLEDPLLSQKTRSEAPRQATLTEGGAAVFLTKKAAGNRSYIEDLTLLQENAPRDRYFGIANPLIHLFEKEN